MNDLIKLIEKPSLVDFDHIKISIASPDEIISVNGNEDQITINNFADPMNLRDSRAFRSYLEEIEPDVNMRQEFKCRMCGHTEEVEIPVTTGFFWPES